MKPPFRIRVADAHPAPLPSGRAAVSWTGADAGSVRTPSGRHPFRIEADPGNPDSGVIRIGGHSLPFSFEDPSGTRAGAGRKGPDPVVRCHMPGLLVRMTVREGDAVAPGDLLAVLEAMKMQNEIRARTAGRVRAVHAAAGATLETNAPLLTIDPS